MPEKKTVNTFDFKKDWSNELDTSEILNKGGRSFVFLRGLERLAKERGIKRAISVVVATPSPASPCSVVTYTYEFFDGATYQGSADATVNNCDKGFRLYLTAMAEARAKARALRTAFGISLCSVEEIAVEPIEEDENSVPANDQQKFLISHLATKHSLSLKDVFELDDNVSANTMDVLTKSEAKVLIARLNRAKPARGKRKKVDK